ncbi:efflux RND transporter periplasmic adaptor subunit [Haliangium sp.]
MGLLHACTEAGPASSALAYTAAPTDAAPAPPENAQAGPRPGGKPAPVELETVDTAPFEVSWQFAGRVTPVLSAELAAAVSGHLLTVEVNEGDRVEEGAVLAQLDSSRVRAELAAARAKRKGARHERKLARRQFRRVRKLSFPTISDAERESYQRDVIRLDAAFDVHRAEVRGLEVELAQHTLQAPFAGVVRSVRVSPGAWVNVGEPVMGLVSLDQLEVYVDVSAEIGARIAVGSAATLVGATPVEAEVAGVVGALDEDTETTRVRLLPQERPGWLVAGMTVTVDFTLDVSDRKGAVAVSRDAVVQGPVSARVFKAAGGKAVPVEVEVLATSEERALVRSDALRAGDRIVARGNERLRPGQVLRVLEGQPDGQPDSETKIR